jgi:integrase
MCARPVANLASWSRTVQKYPSNMMVTAGPGTDRCSVWTLEKAMPTVRGTIEGLPDTFSFHDLRHYLASLLIASGADIKTVQPRMRHASATTTLDTYGHLWPEPTNPPGPPSAL